MMMTIPQVNASFLISIVGICNTICRILSGMLTDLPGVSALVVTFIALGIGGIAPLAMPFCEEYWLVLTLTNQSPVLTVLTNQGLRDRLRHVRRLPLRLVRRHLARHRRDVRPRAPHIRLRDAHLRQGLRCAHR